MQKSLLLVVTALFIHLGLVRAQAAPRISVDFFYDQLGDYGDWVEVGDYGYAWQPRDVDPDWRPYSDGRWAHTEVGWTWLSEEPYAWAVYHYGRWAQIERRGWVWIPGTEWAPAWVSWRRSPKHVGWAPLPPEASFRRSVGISRWADSYYDIGPSAYRFVEVRNFGAPRLRTVFVEPRENITIIRQTTNITQITYVNNVVYNEGPRYEEIARESAEPVRRLRLDRRVEIEGDRSSFRGEQIRSRVEGDSLRVFAPAFDPRAAAPPQRVAAKIEKVEINRGWKDAGPPAEVEKLRAKVRSEAKPPKELPPQPKFEKLAEQAVAPEVKPAPETPAAVAPGATLPAEKMKDRGEGTAPPSAPVIPPGEAKVPPSEKPVAPAAPIITEKPGKPEKLPKATNPEIPVQKPVAPATGEKPEQVVPPGAVPPLAPIDPTKPKAKPTVDQPPSKKARPVPAEAAPRRDAPEAVPGQRPAAPIKPEDRPKTVDPTDAEPANPDRKGKNRKQPEQPRPVPAEAVDPKAPPARPEARREMPPPPEQPAPRKERALPPEPAPRREAPEPLKDEPRKPKTERPEATREVPRPGEGAKPKAERQNPPDVVPRNVPQPAPRGEAEKAKPGKGKAKDDKKPEDEAPKAQSDAATPSSFLPAQPLRLKATASVQLRSS